MPERICAYRAHAQHREIHNQRLIKSPSRPDYQQFSSLVFIFCFHLLFSSFVFISWFHLLFSSLVFISCFHLLLSSLAFISCFHLLFSSLVFISCFHLLCSFVVSCFFLGTWDVGHRGSVVNHGSYHGLSVSHTQGLKHAARPAGIFRKAVRH